VTTRMQRAPSVLVRETAREADRPQAVGALRHASIPGVYAWAVTVAPLLGARGQGAFIARMAAGASLAFLLAGAAFEPRLGPRMRFACLWAFLVACAVAWGASPASLSPARFDAVREVAGMLGWGLFAFAAAAPPLRRSAVVSGESSSESSGEASGQASGVPLPSHRRLARGDGLYAGFGIALALSIQLVGLRAATPERALLVRFVALAAGLAAIGASQELALARHTVRVARRPSARFRSVFAPLAVLLILLLAGVLADESGLVR
jgi:hypothetical protein